MAKYVDFSGQLFASGGTDGAFGDACVCQLSLNDCDAGDDYWRLNSTSHSD
jgi:hypothetical protein